MTKKLFSTILTTCLFFGSLYLPAHAEPASKVPAAKPGLQAKKSPEANFLDGNTCLKAANTACAKLALANIPGTSPYAKLLQGSIAFTEQQSDKALLLLLPLQTEQNLSPQAKIELQQYLASTFESIDDAPQAIQHLIQAESIILDSGIESSKGRDVSTGTGNIHEKIWGFLNKLEQIELVELRGNNTDNTFQGWIDLRLAARNQDPDSAIANWLEIYADHPALAFAKNLLAASTSLAALPAGKALQGSIALLMPPAGDAGSEKADAFKRGLETALVKYKLRIPIATYTESVDQKDSDQAYALAKKDHHKYMIIPTFNAEAADGMIERADTISIVRTGLPLRDEASRIVDFTSGHGMQLITIITTENETSKLMLKSFQEVWQRKYGSEDTSTALSIITLRGDIKNAGDRLLELKSEVASHIPDIILLAMPAAEAASIRPHLDISTPVMAFSDTNEISDKAAAQPFNAVRFADMPFLIATDKETYRDYRAASANLGSNELLRWFALGADSLQLLIASQQQGGEATINGLSGTLTIDSSGALSRRLSLAIFTYNGIEQDQ